MIRALSILLIEYSLMFYVLRSGKQFKYITAYALFLLATYQLGEFILFASDDNYIGVRIAYAATTLLPPIGIFLMQEITKKQFGWIFFQVIAIGFSLYFLLGPEIISDYETSGLFLYVNGFETRVFSLSWGIFYSITLTYGMVIMGYYALKTKSKQLREVLVWLLFAYTSFFISAMIMVLLIPSYYKIIASLMCALAITAAFIYAFISVNNRFDLKEIRKEFAK